MDKIEAVLLATAELCEFWLINGEVYRSPIDSIKDIWNLPAAKRWECSYSHWLKHRESVYGWAADVNG